MSLSGDGVEWGARVAIVHVAQVEAISHLRVAPSGFTSLVALAKVHLVWSGLVIV